MTTGILYPDHPIMYMKRLLFLLLLLGCATAIRAQHTLFGIERDGEAIRWSIPDSLLGRDMALTVSILQAPARTTPDYTKKYGHRGDLFGPIVVRFRKVNGELWVTDPLYDRYLPAGSNDPIVQIARLRGDERLYGTLPICAEADGHTIVDVGEWLKSDPLTSLKPVAFELQLGSEDASLTRIEAVSALPHCMLIRKRMTYAPLPFITPGSQADTHPGEWLLGICLSMLPEQPMPVRPSGKPYFGIRQQTFGLPASSPTSRSLMKRWRLELTPADSARYLRGERVEPVNPIVVYVDRHTPARWIPCIKASVNAWQEAFEQAGFKNAIRAEMEPANDPTFFNYDNSHAYISWKMSGETNAYGPTPCLARTGEVMACHIGIFSSVPDLLQRWYFAQCGATDSTARQIELPRETMDELMKLVFTHEIGHSLGLEHNFFASSLYSPEQLRDNDFLSRHGMGSSIMDYMRCNFVLRPGDRTDLRNRIARIGEYDRWAIEYGYRIFPGETPEEQERNRQEWIERTSADPAHWFIGGNDVQAQSEDLSNDHVAANTQAVENLRYLCAQPAAWTWNNLKELRIRQGRYRYLITTLRMRTSQVLQHLGGQRKASPEALPARENAAYNRKVMNYLQQYALTPPQWLFDPQLASSLELDAQALAQTYCRETMQAVMRRFAPIDKAQSAGAAEAYTPEEYMDGLHDALFGEWSDGRPVGSLKFEAQLAFVRQLDTQLHKSKPTSARVAATLANEWLRLKREARTYAGRMPAGKDRGQALELLNLLEQVTY